MLNTCHIPLGQQIPVLSKSPSENFINGGGVEHKNGGQLVEYAGHWDGALRDSRVYASRIEFTIMTGAGKEYKHLLPPRQSRVIF